MNPLRRGIAASVLLLAAVRPLAAAGAEPEQEIRRLEAEINAAYAANDLPKYFSYYAEDFRGLFPDGFTTLPEYVKMWTGFVHDGGAVLAFDYTDVQVQVSPGADAAVASYRASVRIRYPKKEPVVEKYFETDVFFKRAGQWKLVEVHYAQEVKPN
jgi:ketosteroid isomerase-like protein